MQGLIITFFCQIDVTSLFLSILPHSALLGSLKMSRLTIFQVYAIARLVFRSIAFR